MDKKLLIPVALFAALMMAGMPACKDDGSNRSGSGDDDDDDSGGFVATSIEFAPASGGGDAGDVWLELDAVELPTNTLRLRLMARGLPALFGIAGEMAYDNDVISLGEAAESAAMGEGGASVLAAAADNATGGVFGLARERAQSGSIAVTDATELGTLTFRATGAGEATITFNDERSHVLDDGLEAVEVARWLGGTVTVE